ncbi:MAG: hypothetical protein E6K80_10435 [Candidatus Eisenbacteria bacterium]|uniref:FlgD Ig-like domain-containing protein n=1 Tax=Eiseniibacteriota bacterium TaxID=2212470 RepID=A0A538U1V3_UNCEI|nr:MAG: hypothetical protein E6K80_10435 [Candidatus Eisenbacteria bacterium]
MSVSRRSLSFLLGSLLAAGAAMAATRPSFDEIHQHVLRAKRLEAELLRLTAKEELAESSRARIRARHRVRGATRSTSRRGAASAARPAPGSDLPPLRPEARAPRAAATRIAGIPSNVKINDSLGDAPNATQSEGALAASGDQVVAAWNDGQGSFTGGAYQGFAWSPDGGQTWTDGGDPPKPAGLASFRWTSDPVLTVDERSGVFYYAALANSDATHNALAVARGRFTGGVFAWQDVQLAREVSNQTALLDKPWIAADSSGGGGAVDLAYTLFTVAGDEIDLQRSADGGATWSAASKLSSAADDGQVQAARPALGPAGEVYVLWNAIGQSTAEDFLRLRKSTNHGVSFAAEVTVTGYIANFGTGGPGFNRERGIHFPTIAVDRTSGSHRGRVYVGWTEAYNFQDDALGTGASRVEAEPNGFAVDATPFTPGDVLRGTIASAPPADFDRWAFTLAAGQSLVAWADSLGPSMTYGMRVFGGGADSVQSLCFGGDITPGSDVQQAFYTFKAPVTATYTLRMGPIDGSSPIGGYRVRTGFGVRGTERGRDQRDVFVSWSNDGSAWSVPARVNDDPVGFDDFLAEVGVGGDGFPYAAWFDYRDETFGATSNQYVARSEDGGATWGPNQRLTSVATNWTNTGSNLAPNMGDYSALIGSGPWLHPTWADGRDGSADVYGTRLGTGVSIAACALDRAVTSGSSTRLDWTLSNPNAVFANSFTGSITTARNWPLPAPTGVTVPASGVGALERVLAIPDTAAPGPVAVTLTAVNATGAMRAGCVTTLRVGSPLDVGGEPSSLALAPPVPNPASAQVGLGFAIPTRGRVALRVYGVGGRRVRTLIEGELGPGPHQAVWDGRDESGAAVAPGIYFARLETAAGERTRRIVWRR